MGEVGGALNALVGMKGSADALRTQLLTHISSAGGGCLIVPPFTGGIKSFSSGAVMN